jgi:hypothetical protein
LVPQSVGQALPGAVIAGMVLLPFKPIELAAVDPGRNIRRRWRVTACHDLFGHVIVETNWGRIGAVGRNLARAFPTGSGARYVAGLFGYVPQRGDALGELCACDGQHPHDLA